MPANLGTYREKIDRIARVLDSCDETRDRYLIYFPIWKKKREKCIKTVKMTAAGLKEVRENSNIARIAAGTTGFLGKICTIASLLAPVTNGVSVAVTGGILTTLAAVGNTATSIRELAVTQDRLKGAKRILEEDDRLLKKLGVFEFLDELNSAVNNLFGSSTSNKILNDLIEFLRKIPPNLDRVQSCISPLRDCIQNLLPEMQEFLVIGCPSAAVILSITFVVFMVKRRGCAIFKHSVALGLFSSVSASVEITKLVAASGWRDSAMSQLIPRELKGRIAVGAIAGVGLGLDVATVVINTIDLSRKSYSEEVKMMNAVAQELQAHLEKYQDLYDELVKSGERRLRRRQILYRLLLLAVLFVGILYIYIFQ